MNDILNLFEEKNNDSGRNDISKICMWRYNNMSSSNIHNMVLEEKEVKKCL